jgi:hypothetical protein
MSKNIITILSIIITVIIALIAGYKQTVITDLQGQILTLKNTPAKTITVTDTKIEYVYKDSKPVKISKPPEAKVVIDTDRIESLYSEISQLEYELSIVAKDTTYIVRSDSIRVVIERIKEVLKDPIKNNLISVQRWGYLFKPMVGVGYSGTPVPYVGAKLGFVDMYGVSIGSTTDMIGVSLHRHIYDLVKYLPNTDVFIMGGIPYKKGNSNFAIGVAVSL